MQKLIFVFFICTLLSGCARPQSVMPPIGPLDKQTKVYPPTIPFKQNKGLIVIDPGHGGDDFGTQSLTNPKYHEKSLNLVTATFLSAYLQQMGYNTLMTRSKDLFIPLLERASIANENPTTLFVSVHYNSAPSKEAHGIEIFYYDSKTDPARAKASQELAKTILSRVIQMTHARSRGVKTENFAVIRETKMPAVLIEGGFVTNAEEFAKIKQPEYVKKLAWGIAEGVDQFLSKKKLNSGQ